MEEEILGFIYDSEDKLLTALKYAMIGNFIDFGAMDKVDIDELRKLIKDVPQQLIDAEEYEGFVEKLKMPDKSHILLIMPEK